MTFQRGLRCIVQWWWIAAICVVGVALLGASAAGHTLSSATATARIHVQDTVLSYSPATGDPQPFTQMRNVNDLTKSDFVNPQAAAAAAAALGGTVNASDFIGNLGFTALTGTDVSLTYGGSGSEAESARRLNAYVLAFLKQRQQADSRPLVHLADQLGGSGSRAPIAARLRDAAASLPQQIYQVGVTTTSPAKKLPSSLLFVGGLIAGAILGTIIALLLGRFDPRIGRASDLRVAGWNVLEVNPNRSPRSAETLRALVEAQGVGPSGGAVSVMAVGSPSRMPLSCLIADSFVSAGRPTVLMTDKHAVRSGEAGWLPVGDEYPPGALLSLERLSETIRAIRPAGGVVVVDVPALGAGPEGVVAAGASDVILLALQQNRTTWAQLERSLEVLTAANAQGRVCICLDGRPPSRDAIDMLSWGFVEPQQVRAPTAL